jgi:Ca2+-binding EF-hand superfamily protein
MRKLLTVALTGAALTAASAVFAQNAPAPAAPARGAAEMTRDQAQARAAEAFGRLDRNRDGKLDLADREVAQAERQKAAFDRADADHNGAISYAEFTASRDQRGERAGGRRGDRRGPMARGRGNGARLTQADTNKDGAVTREEFAAQMLQRFDRADSNKDGKVTRDERRDAFRGMRGPGRAPAAG